MSEFLDFADRQLTVPFRIEVDGQSGQYSIEDIAIGNFDNDPWPDLYLSMVTLEGAGSFPVPIAIASGQADGSYILNTTDYFEGAVPSSSWAPRVVSADFNSDGLLDVFIPDSGQDAPPFPGGQNFFVMSTSAGYVETLAGIPEELNFTHGASIGDVDNDGDLDLLVNNLNSTTGRAAQLLINDGSGLFQEQNQRLPDQFVTNGQYNGGHTWSIIEDFNNDGSKDIVLGAWTAQENTTLHLNDGSGNFSQSPAIALPLPDIVLPSALDMEAVDLNGDEFPDLIVSYTDGGDFQTGENFYTQRVLQFLINQNGTGFIDVTTNHLLEPWTQDDSWIKFIDIADLNGDSHYDIVLTGAGGTFQRHAVLHNNGFNQFAETASTVQFSTVHVAQADTDIPPEIIYSSFDGVFVSQGEAITANFSPDNVVYWNSIPATLNTGDGLDTLIIDSRREDLVISVTDQNTIISEDDTSRVVSNIERLQLADGTLALDIDGGAGQTYRLYKAAFDRTPDTSGLSHNVALKDQGLTLKDLAGAFIASAEFQSLYGADPSTEEFITLLYNNVLDRGPDQAGFAGWSEILTSGQQDRADVLLGFSESLENQNAVAAQISDGIWLG